MPAFEYLALNSAGKEERGIQEADTPRQVRQLLRSRDMVPLEVHEVAQQQKKAEGRSLLGSGRLSPADLALMTRQLATLVRAGFPVEEALDAIVRQAERPAVQRMFSAIRSRVMEGYPLADALKSNPRAFPPIYCATVGAGEQSGHLPAVLERLADYTENHQHSQQKIVGALFYPMALLVFMLGVVSILLTSVVPSMVEAFKNLCLELPPLTLMVIAISHFLSDYWWALLLGVGVLVAGITWLLQQPDWKYRYHRWLLKLPVVGRVVRGVNTEHFASTLSILTSSGVNAVEAMNIASKVVMNLPMRGAVEEATKRVREGSPISKALHRSGYFPPMMVSLISSGENSSKLGEMLERAATQQERDTQVRLAALSSLMGPGLLLVMGGMVLMILLAIMSPVMKGMKDIKNNMEHPEQQHCEAAPPA